MQSDRTPNRFLWMLKGISCIIVVLMHSVVPHPLSKAVSFCLRFPLPIFYMISGYFSFRKDNVLVYIRKLIWLILGGELLAGIVTEILFRFGAESTGALQILAALNIPRILLFGTIFNRNLWYLYTTAWAWGVYHLIRKAGLFRWAYYGIFPMLALPIAVKLICGAFLKLDGFDEMASQYDYLFRIVFIYGLPFILLGRWMAEHRTWIQSHITPGIAAAVIAAGFLLDGAEYLLIHYYMEMQLSTIVIAIGLFLLAVLRPDFAPLRGMTYIGRELSTMVYVIQLPILQTLQALLRSFAPALADTLVYPAAGVLLTVGVSLAVRLLGRRIR